MNTELKPKKTKENEPQPITAADYVAGIETYLSDAERDHVLRPHQTDIFHDLQGFFREGATKGYVTAPTGTGKTVIFVELSKALLEAEKTAGRKPNILVVEPTINLVNQTLGRTGKKGYGKFAPGLEVSSFFSESTDEDKLLLHKANVAITTYDSLSIMTRREEVRDQTDEEKDDQLRQILDQVTQDHGSEITFLYQQLESLHSQIKRIGRVATGRTLFDLYDVIILDEAHAILGNSTGALIDSIGKDKTVIGFTATPDANEKKRMTTHLPVKIHNLTYKEASDLELVAPLASIGLRSHIKIGGSDVFDKEGEFQDEKLAHLVSTNSRNRLIANTALTLVEHGFGTLIPCIAGEGARHARMLADTLNRMGVASAAIYSGIPAKERERLLEDFEQGKLDVLTNIRVLREGYDSDRAKAIIEAAPTRSLIIKRQRIGRVVRAGDIAVVVDIIDEYDRMNPPLHLPDILEGQDIAAGEIYGSATEEQRERIVHLVESLGRSAMLVDTIPADYSKLLGTLAEYPQIVNGKVRSNRQGHFSVSERISPKYKGVNDEIIRRLWQMNGLEPDVELGRQNYNIRVLFDVGRSVQLLREVPECDKNRAYVEKGERWLSAEGFVLGFTSKFPDLNIGLMEERLQELGDRIDWRPLKTSISRTSSSQVFEAQVYKAYRADKDTLAILSKQLKDYFEITEATHPT